MNGLIVDIGMMGLLIAVMKVAWDLNKNLKHFRQSESHLAPTLQTLSKMIEQSSRNIDLIKITANDVNKSLETTLPKAEEITDELKYLMDHAERLAQRLEHTCDRSRKVQQELLFTVDHAGNSYKEGAYKEEGQKNHASRSFSSSTNLHSFRNTPQSLEEESPKRSRSYHTSPSMEEESQLLKAIRGLR
jgi:uncharacterized protein YoxC